MRLLRSLHLRRKFLLITGIAFLLPLSFFALFLGVCLISIGEIEQRTMSDKILEMESLVRRRIGHLERAARSIREEIGTGAGNAEEIFQDRGSHFLQNWLKELSLLDLAVLRKGDQGTPLFVRDTPHGESDLSANILETLEKLSKSKSGSGLIRILNKTYLVHLSLDTDPVSGMNILVGIDFDEELFPTVSLADQGQFVITEISLEEVPARQESAWQTIDPKGTVTLHRALRGLIPGSWFDLQYTSQVALFNQLRTRLVWFPMFFLGAVLISGLIGTAWATTLVLRPLKRMGKTMASMTGPEDYSFRVTEDSQDEIGDLATSFNRLMARLEKAQKELESVQMARLESEKVATLHATVITLAHQINNPLAALVGQAELLLLDSKTPVKMKKSLEVIRDMGLRIAEVIKQLQDADKVQTTTYLRTQNMLQIEVHPPQVHEGKDNRDKGDPQPGEVISANQK